MHDGFHLLAAEEPERFVVVDGIGTIEEVAARVDAGLAARGLGAPR